MGEKIEVRRRKEFTPSHDLSPEAEEELELVEWQSLHEASLCSGNGSFVASEFMSTRALESISIRLTNEGNWADAIDELKDEHPQLTGPIEYLKEERNKVAHADKEKSSSIEARQTYDMVVRMIEDLLGPE